MHTGEQYVSAEGWRESRLDRCPNHPHGGCWLARHGTYARKRPANTQIARWYCRESHTTLSLLPDCLAARMPGTLTELEKVVVEAEQAGSLMAVADQLRRNAVELPGAMRWVRRRVHLVHHVLFLRVRQQKARVLSNLTIALLHGEIHWSYRDGIEERVLPKVPSIGLLYFANCA